MRDRVLSSLRFRASIAGSIAHAQAGQNVITHFELIGLTNAEYVGNSLRYTT